ALDLMGHGRGGHRREHRADRVEPLAHRRALGAADHVRREPPATETADQPRAILRQRLRVGVPLPAHPPPPCSGETPSAAGWFPAAAESPCTGWFPAAAESPCTGWFPAAGEPPRTGEPCMGEPRRCERYGSSRARPRAHRLFTVPWDTPSITATSATG